MWSWMSTGQSFMIESKNDEIIKSIYQYISIFRSGGKILVVQHAHMLLRFAPDITMHVGFEFL